MRMLTQRSTTAIFSVLILILSALLFNACESPDPTGPAASARITLTTTRSSLPADGSSTCVITAYVLNRNGNPADGPIYWSTSCGTLDIATGTISGGYASVTLTAPNYGCTAVITADAVHAQKSIEIPIYAYGLDLDANPSSIPADGSSTSNLVAYVFDNLGNPIEDGTTVNFSSTLGTLSATSATTNGGWASVTLTSGTVTGTAIVTANVEAAEAKAYVEFTSTEIGGVLLTANPSKGIPANGASYSVITATVTQTNGRPAVGVAVSFANTWGNLEYFQVTTDENGIATNRLFSSYSNTDKTATVSGTAGDKTGYVNVQFERYFGTPEASPTPRPTSTNTPTPTWTATPTMTPTPPANTATPAPTSTFSPTPAGTSTPTFTPMSFTFE